MSQALIKRVPLNLLTNFIVFLLGIVINLFMTPFYIKHLGIDGLGVIRLALLLPVYINLATLIISGAVSRFLTIDIQENRYDNGNITFNTSFFSIGTILIVSIPVAVFFAINISSFVDIPKLYSSEAIYLFLGIFLSSQLTIFSTLFLIPAYANNRLDIQNFIRILVLFVQTTFIIMTFIFVSTKISYVGYAYFLSSLIGIVLSVFVWKKFAPGLSLNLNFFSYKKFKEMASMGSWLIVNQLGSILFLSVDLIIINHYFGSKSTGEYSIILQWSTLLRALAGTIASVITPMILISYAKKNILDIIKYSKLSVKFMGIFIAVPIGLILGFSNPLLALWLGSQYSYLTPLLWIAIVHLVINLSVLPLFSIFTAYNKVKLPGLMSLLFGVLNFILAIYMAVELKYGLYGIALAGAIVLTFKNAIFTPMYAAHLLNLNLFSFLRYLLQGIGVFVFSYAVSATINMLGITSWLALVIYGIISILLIIFFIWVLVLSNDDKNFIKNKILRKKG